MLKDFIEEEYSLSKMDNIEKARLFFTLYEDLVEIFGMRFAANLDIIQDEIQK